MNCVVYEPLEGSSPSLPNSFKGGVLIAVGYLNSPTSGLYLGSSYHISRVMTGTHMPSIFVVRFSKMGFITQGCSRYESYEHSVEFQES